MRILHLLDCSAGVAAMRLACEAAVSPINPRSGGHRHAVIAVGPSRGTKAGVTVPWRRVALPMGMARLALPACRREMREIYATTPGASAGPEVVQVWGHRLKWLGARLAGGRASVVSVNDVTGEVEACRGDSRGVWSKVGRADAVEADALPTGKRAWPLDGGRPVIGFASDIPTPEEMDGLAAMLAMLTTAGVAASGLVGVDAPSLARARRHALTHPVADIRVTDDCFADRAGRCDVLLSGIQRRGDSAPELVFRDAFTLAWAARRGTRVLVAGDGLDATGATLVARRRPSEFAALILASIGSDRELAVGGEAEPKAIQTPKAHNTEGIDDLVQLAWWRAANGRA